MTRYLRYKNMKAPIGIVFLVSILASLLTVGCNNSAEMSGTQPSSAVKAHLNDSDVNRGVMTALLQDKTLSGATITAITTKGDVMLTGVLDNQGQIDHADQLVAGILGVDSVHNHLTINQKSSTAPGK
jgi:hyperosmotically inducible periplasmic protein